MHQLTCATPQEVVTAHFETWVKDDYQGTRGGFEQFFRLLGGRPAKIIETGTSAWGVDSTRLLDDYVRRYGGQFWSVDLREEPRRYLAGSMGVQTQLLVSDSVTFLQELAHKRTAQSINAFYLDSYDLDWVDPEASERHCLAEWEAVCSLAADQCLVLIDDTPKSLNQVPPLPMGARKAAQQVLEERGFLPGKGALVLKLAQSNPRVEVVWHQYNVLLRIHLS